MQQLRIKALDNQRTRLGVADMLGHAGLLRGAQVVR